MKFSALDISIGDVFMGVLFKYGGLIRLQVDPEYANNPNRPLLSLSMLAENPEQNAALLLNPLAPIFNSPGENRLPPFFQNLLPEGVLRKHIAAERGCSEDDYFELLAACGADLPGNVFARPTANTRELARKLVTQNQDVLEESVVADPLDDGISLSGIQPKLGLVARGGRFVAGRRHGDSHIIGKLPTVQHDLLPEVEYLSLQLAKAAGVTVCEATLEPLSTVVSPHEYILGKSKHFLAVKRFDRDRPGRLHAEDFAQVMSVDPDNKYTGGSYADIARIMLKVNGLGQAAVLELIRRITVSELIGNYDFHLKNIGVLHQPDGRIELSPAYDIVAYSVYIKEAGHALAFADAQPKRHILGPAAIRHFCNDVGISEVKARNIVAEVCTKAVEKWPDMIAGSKLMPAQKERLLAFFHSRPLVKGLLRRQQKNQAAFE
jgi:serine/threonine-protein kinase HipA